VRPTFLVARAPEQLKAKSVRFPWSIAVALLLATAAISQNIAQPRAGASANTRIPQLGRAWQVLEEGVADKKVVNRLALFSAMGDLGPNLKGVRLSERGLNDKDPDVRAAAATSLGEMKSRAAIPKLRIALADKPPRSVLRPLNRFGSWGIAPDGVCFSTFSKEKDRPPTASFRVASAICKENCRTPKD
jgi:HEAT repeat protein